MAQNIKNNIELIKKAEEQAEKPIDKFLKIEEESNALLKDKRITLRINSEVWAQFTELNRQCGISNSSMISMLVTEHIRERNSLK